MIDPKQYGTMTEAAQVAGVSRSTLIDAVNRGDVESTQTIGGTPLVSIKSAKRFATKRPNRGPKPQGKS